MKKLYVRIPMGILLLLGLFSLSQAQQHTTPFGKKTKHKQHAPTPEQEKSFQEKWNIRKINGSQNPQPVKARVKFPSKDTGTSQARSITDIQRITLDPRTELPILIQTRSQLTSRSQVHSFSAARALKDQYLRKSKLIFPIRKQQKSLM